MVITNLSILSSDRRTSVRKTALVTGASRNIGRAIAIGLAQEGVDVWICARDSKTLEETLDEMRKLGGNHGAIIVDLLAEDGVETLVNKLRDADVSPDIIVHNLGGSAGITDPMAPVSDYANVWWYNVGIGHELNRRLLPTMISRKWGRLIHIGTAATRHGRANLAYVSAKSALDGYVKTMSRHLAPDGIVMAMVAPGVVDLEGRYFTLLEKNNDPKLEKFYDTHLPSRGMVEPENVAEAVTFLTSEKGAMMHGSTIAIDGGIW